ncbi:unnamed protein product [Macrosiphum euphorbiae]|nr:unnamed protein product [Macrosiphum euphorbiae]
MEFIKEPKEFEDKTVTEIKSCINSSPVILEIQMEVEKVIEEVPPVLINSSSIIIGEKTKVNMDTEYETILLIKSTIGSIEEPEISEDMAQTKILSCTAPSNATVNVQTDVEKVIEEVSMAPINCSVEEVGGKSYLNIHTENETFLPFKLTMETIAIPKKVEDITETEISSCTDSCILTVDTQTDEEKRLDEVTPEPINSSRETNMDIDTGKETILPIKISTSLVEDRKAIEETTEIVLPIESTMEFKKEPNVVKDITVTEITPCTDSSYVIVETKIDVERVINEVSMVPINSFDEKLGGKSKANIGTVNETILPIKTSNGSVEDRKAIEGTTVNILLIEKTIEFEEESIVVEDINVTEITTCTDSSSGILKTKIVDSYLEKVIEEVPTVLINSSCKIIGEKTKVNMDTEYETILPIKSTIESVEEPNAVEDIIETEITSCTESSTENIMDVQSKKEKYMAKKSPAPINSLVEDVSEKSKVNFDTEDKKFLPMVSTKESLEKELDEVSPEPINSSGKVVVEKTNMNIDIENETILPIKTSICPVEDRKAIEIIVLPIEFTVEFKKEKKGIVEDIPVTETTPCTDSCILTVDDQTSVEKELDEVTLVLFDSSGKIIGEKTKVNMDTEYETILPSEASYESIEEPKVVEDITETEITSCTESSTESMMDVQTNNEKYMAKKSPAPSHSSVEEVGGILKVNIDSEDEKLLPMKFTMESVAIPKTGEGITETEIVSYTDSCILTVDAQIDVEKKLDEVTPVLFNSSGKIIGEKTKVSMGTEYETILPIEASYVSIEEPKVVEGITETEIASCTESSTKSMMDVQTNNEKYMAKKSLAPINSSVGEVDGKLKVNIDSKDEKLLPIVSTKESIEETKIEPTVVADTEILSCMESSTIIMNYQNHTEKTVDKVPINYLSEVMGENINVNIVTENETHLPIGSTMEAVEEPNVVEDITEIEKRLSTGSSSIKLDNTIYVEKVIEEVPSVLIDPSDKVVGENPKVNIYTEYETNLLIESTIESIPESEIYEDITETEILSCTEPSTGNVVAQTDVEKVIGEVSLTLINSSDKVVGEEMNVNIDNENETLLPINTSTRYVKDKKEIYTLIETLLPIESTVESIEAQKVEDITEPKFTSCTESSTEIIDNQNQTEKIVDQKHLVLINSSDVEVGGNTNVNIDTVPETLLPVGSTMQSIEVSKEVEDIKETEKIPYTGSFPITIDIHTDVEKITDKKSPKLITSFGELVQKNMNMNINTENETLLPYELTIESIEESNVVDDRTEIEITSYTEPLTKTINSQFREEKIIDKVKLNSLGEVMEENTNMKIVTESETLLSIGSTKESILEPKVEEDITVTTKTSCADFSTLTVDVQTDVEKVIEEVSPVPIHSSGEVVGESTKLYIDTENEKLLQIDPSNSSVEEMKEIDELIETLSPMKSNMESIKVSKKIEVIKKTEKISFTDSSILTKDFQTDVDIVIEKKSPAQINFLVNILGENTKVNNDIENETILPIESTEEITVEPKVEADITETAITSCTDSSTVTVDVQTDVEKVIEEVSPVPIYSSGEVVGESTKLYIDTENEKLLQIDTSITAVKAVLEEKMIENEYLTPTFSAILDVEKQINVIIDSKTETLFPIGTNTTFVNEPNVVGRVSENEHAPLKDSSITSIKQQIKVDTETEIETLLLIDNLTESIKEQIVEKITENKTPTLIDSLAEMVGEGNKVNIVTDNQTLLTINTSSKIEDDQIVKNGIKNETQTPIVNVTEEQTKVNIETNNKTITPINIFTTSIEEQLNVEYLCENENTTHIDSVPTMIKNQTKIDIETENENENLLSIENTSFEEQMDEVDKIIQNNLLVDFSAATELKGYEILTDTETETSTSIDTLNTTADRQTMKENFKEIESRIRIDTSTAFEEEQKSVEHITVKENVLSIGTSTASVEEEIQVEEVIKNECATLISYSTIHDVASLEEPKVIKNDTTAMRSSVTVVEEQKEVAATEVVIDTCKKSLDKTMIEKGTRHNETLKPIDTLVIAADEHTDLKKVAENEMPILLNTSTKSVEKQITTEKVTENETITIITCEALPKIETNEFEAESENEASTLVNNSASITIKQTEAEDITETALQNDDIIYRNTKTNLIGTQNKTENSDNPNDCYLKFGESSKMHRLDYEDNLQRKSYGIQKLEMSVQRMKTSDEDYYEKTFVQLEQTEKISKVDKVNVDGENKTIIDDKLYTVNESDLNSILCASSLEEALTLLDSKIKFKFKHKKSSSKINSMEYIPKIQTSDSNSSGVNTNFTDARKFFKEIEKKSKK